MTGTYTPAKAIHDVVRFSPGGKKNRGKEEKGERTWPPAEGRHDVVWFSPGGKKNRGKEEQGERTWPPAEVIHIDRGGSLRHLFARFIMVPQLGNDAEVAES